MYLLEQLSAIAAAAHAPFIGAVSPELFGLGDFRNLSDPRDLELIFHNETFFRPWNEFRRTPQAAYSGLVLPRLLSRLPYGRADQAIREFEFEENVDGGDHSKYLWATAVYALAARLANAFSRFG